MVTVCESFTELCQWLLNKLETHDLKECESTLKYEIWWWNWGKMSKVICTGVCVGPAHIRKTVDKNVPKSTGMSRVSSCESVCLRVCLIRSSVPILDPRVSHLFYAICHIYYSHISDMHYFFCSKKIADSVHFEGPSTLGLLPFHLSLRSPSRYWVIGSLFRTLSFSL